MTRYVLIVAFLACGVSASGQRLIHDEQRDRTAQDAAAAAKEVASGSLFAKMLANVDAQARQEADTQMAFVEQQMRAKLENFTRWSDARDVVATELPGGVGVLAGRCRSLVCELESIRVRLNFFLRSPAPTPAELATRLKALETKKAQLEEALKQLRKAAEGKGSAVARTFELLEDPGSDILDYAKKVGGVVDQNGVPLKGVLTALDRIGDGLDELLSIYKVIQRIWAGYAAVSVDPASLRPPQELLDLRLLAIEQDHLKTNARIEAQRDLDAGLALRHVETALGRLDASRLRTSVARVEDTLRQQVAAKNALDPRVELRTTLDLLHDAASVAAEEDAAGRLAALRLSDEERRYSIRRSAVNASAYDQAIQSVGQRLAAYWKAGIKPGDLAQLAFYLTNTFAIPAIALK